MLLQARDRKLTLICANPDIVVERGDRLIYCAGAIAELYRELGGEVIFYGKPHRPIYERAMELAAERQHHPIKLDRVLAIGDSVRTDLAGAHGFGIDCLFVTRGIHAEEFQGIDQLDPASLKRTFRPSAARADARTTLVARLHGTRSSMPYALTVSGKTASILVLSVAALNGLTM